MHWYSQSSLLGERYRLMWASGFSMLLMKFSLRKVWRYQRGNQKQSAMAKKYKKTKQWGIKHYTEYQW